MIKPDKYYFSPSAVSMNLNAQSSGVFTISETIQVVVSMGAAVRVANQLTTEAGKVLELGYNAQLGYRQFSFTGANTVLGYPGNKYIGSDIYAYIRLDASDNGANGELVFLPYMLDYDGTVLGEGTPTAYEDIPLESKEDEEGNTYYAMTNSDDENASGLTFYYIHIASISKPDSGKRNWLDNLNNGQLDTAKGNNEKASAALEKMFKLVNNVINVLLPLDKITFQKSGTAAFIDRIITTVSESLDDFAAWASTSAIATTASVASYLSAQLKSLDSRFFRKDQDDASPFSATFGALSTAKMKQPDGSVSDGSLTSAGKTDLATSGEKTTMGGDVDVKGNGVIEGELEVRENAKVKGDAVVDGELEVQGDAKMRTTVFGDFVKGLLGVGSADGAMVSEDGTALFRRVEIGEALIVPEIQFNRASVTVGIGLTSVGGGIIEEVYAGETSGRASLRLEDGEFGAVALGDKMLGFWHNLTDNAAASRDDRNGDYELQGFQSIYFVVDGFYENELDFRNGTNVKDVPSGNNKYFHYALRTSGVNGWTKRHHPHAGLHFGLIANNINKERQSLKVTTTEYEVRLQNLTDWNYDYSNIVKIDGKLDGFSMPSQKWNGTEYETYQKEFVGNGTVLGNAYIYGKLDQFERVAYRCFVEQSFGGSISPNEVEKETVTIWNGYGEDVTHEFTRISVTRDSGDASSDAAWNAQHTNVGNPFYIGFPDLGIDGINRLSTQFYVTATNEADGTRTSAAMLEFL